MDVGEWDNKALALDLTLRFSIQKFLKTEDCKIKSEIAVKPEGVEGDRLEDTGAVDGGQH